MPLAVIKSILTFYEKDLEVYQELSSSPKIELRDKALEYVKEHKTTNDKVYDGERVWRFFGYFIDVDSKDGDGEDEERLIVFLGYFIHDGGGDAGDEDDNGLLDKLACGDSGDRTKVKALTRHPTVFIRGVFFYFNRKCQIRSVSLLFFLQPIEIERP
ncbi:hypothetical protein L1987_16230 [Smallanthus sonchifolius]|uniref:Uncharacterized protein n=1 Tax=Smallanthus sonchifolius TaxID=185202 RepID=A0ACB9J8L6_9ASTR|nr:hypothetical protein L1987_16230 [Smallanthus sonchifolius]